MPPSLEKSLSKESFGLIDIATSLQKFAANNQGFSEILRDSRRNDQLIGFARLPSRDIRSPSKFLQTDRQ